MRVGILTGGGDCQGLNAAIRAVAKTLMLNCQAEIIGIEDGFAGFLERRVRPLSYKDCSGILALGGTILGTSNKATPFNYHGQDCSADVMNYYHELGLDAVVMIGGDGTMTMAHEFAKMGMNIVGVPKTIDNDLMCTERTFGFETAVSIVSDAIDRLRTTGQSHKRVMILETMGRYAGWIALHAGVAGGADVILLPEFPYDLDEVIKACKVRTGQQQYSLIVVAEGAKPKGGNMSVQQTVSDSPDTVRLGGISEILKQQLEQHVHAEVRATSLGHIQRGGSPIASDRIFATNVGRYAADLVRQGQFGQVVVLQQNKLLSVPLVKVANKTRGVTLDDITLNTALALGISFGCADIAR